MRADFFTSLTPTECLARVRERIDVYNPWRGLPGLFGSKPVVGALGDSWLELRARPRDRYNNPLPATLRARLQRDAGGTVVSLRAGVHPLVIAAAALFCGAFAAVGLLILWNVVPSTNGGSTPARVLGGLLFLGVPFFTAGFVRRRAAEDAEFLAAFLSETLEAEAAAKDQG